MQEEKTVSHLSELSEADLVTLLQMFLPQVTSLASESMAEKMKSPLGKVT